MVSRDEIKDIEVTSSNEALATVNTSSSFGERFTIKTTGENDGLLYVDIYAFNDEAEQSVNDQETFYLLNPLNIVEITGTDSGLSISQNVSVNNSSFTIGSDLLKSVNVKIKDEFKDRFSIEPVNYDDAIIVSEENGVCTFTNTTIPDRKEVKCHAIIKFDNDNFAYFYVRFSIVEGGSYAIDDSDVYLYVYDFPDVEDGQTVNLSLSENHYHDCNIEIDPVILTESESITKTCISSNTSVVSVGEMVYLYGGNSYAVPDKAKFPLTLVSVGEAVITANVSDNFGYSKTYTFTVIVSE